MKYLLLLLFTPLFFQCTETEKPDESFIYTPPDEPFPINNYPCTLTINPYDTSIISLTEFPISNTTIRALEVINDSTVWFAGSNGYWGYTLNNGKSWHTEQFKMDSITPEFRSISVTENGDVFLVSIVKPAAIFKSSDIGKHWNMVHSDADTNAFFDAVEFWNNKNGILLGDAINNCFHVALTHDGGETWNSVNCDDLPPSLTSENPFAASNTNISVYGTHAWFGTGGLAKSRVYHTPDLGKSWAVINTPITSGKTMTGIYSIHFTDAQHGVVAGGNWNEVTATDSALAFTNDGGKTWIKKTSPFGFISCAQFLPSSTSEIFILQGRARGGESAMGYSNDLGETWQTFPNSNYLGIQFSSNKVAWISGKNKIARIDFK